MNRSPQSSAGVIPPCDAAAPGSRFSPVTAPGITLPAAAAPVVAAGRAPQAGAGTAGEGGPDPGCGHGIGMHDIRRDKNRGRCSVLLGPRGKQCECDGSEFR